MKLITYWCTRCVKKKHPCTPIGAGLFKFRRQCLSWGENEKLDLKHKLPLQYERFSTLNGTDKEGERYAKQQKYSLTLLYLLSSVTCALSLSLVFFH